DWSRECVRRPDGSEGDDLCWVTQVLKDDNGRPFGKFSVRRVPAGSQAVAQADVAVSLELVPYLPAGVTLGVDKGLAREYEYLFCSPATGCLVQPNLSQADIEAFKAGDVLNMRFAIVAKPTELATITSPISLKGFTAAWDSVPAPTAPAAQ
ncbi:MAG: invasion associated locus B family protein, partial [Maritimibacter sp.]|nr:invasion associated locus B family protein [Maritimibacter sp.]